MSKVLDVISETGLEYNYINANNKEVRVPEGRFGCFTECKIINKGATTINITFASGAIYPMVAGGDPFILPFHYNQTWKPINIDASGGGNCDIFYIK